MFVRPDPHLSHAFCVAAARLAVKVLRDRRVEGYIVFEGDPRRYEFTPESDFVYPAMLH